METYDFEGCSDCLMFVANGDMPEDREGFVEDFELWTEGFVICLGDNDIDLGFSWSRCECCGSRLGGDRHRLVGFESFTKGGK